MNLRLVIFSTGFIMMFASSGFGQTGGADGATRQDTTFQINALTAKDDSISGYKKDKDFKYISYLDSLLRQTKSLAVDTMSSEVLKGRKIERSQRYNSNNSDANNFFKNPLVRILLTLLAIFFIGVILFRFFFTEGIFKKEGSELKEELEKKEEIITDPNSFNRLINEAVANKDYRLAIRYMYLQTLHNLSTRNLIELSPEKTNSHYIHELRSSPSHREFASLTRSYEYAWYGKFEMDETQFNQLQNYFKQFLLNI